MDTEFDALGSPAGFVSKCCSDNSGDLLIDVASISSLGESTKTSMKQPKPLLVLKALLVNQPKPLSMKQPKPLLVKLLLVLKALLVNQPKPLSMKQPKPLLVKHPKLLLVLKAVLVKLFHVKDLLLLRAKMTIPHYLAHFLFQSITDLM